MEKLKDNERAAYAILEDMARKENPVRISLRTFPLMVRTRDWFWKWKYRPASHMTVKNLLLKLQKKGLITLDYSDRSNPKIKVIIN